MSDLPQVYFVLRLVDLRLLCYWYPLHYEVDSFFQIELLIEFYFLISFLYNSRVH